MNRFFRLSKNKKKLLSDEENERWAEELMPSNGHYLTMLQFIVS